MLNVISNRSSQSLLDPVIFREYDIRGTFETQLSLEAAFLIGQAFGAWIAQEYPSLFETSAPCICVAHDGRLSSPDLARVVSEGLLSQGIDVVFLSLGPTPFLYWAENHLNVAGGMMITGSHNPPQDNGIKITFGKKPFFGKQIQELYHLALQKRPLQKRGHLSSESLLPLYTESLLKTLSPPERLLKIVWDPGNGAFGTILKQVTDRLPHTSVILHEQVDGTFPHRSPDPTKPKALQKLSETILREKADIGFAFDGDGDRVVMVDNKGIPLAGDELLFLLASQFLLENPHLKVVADIKCSPFLLRILEEKGAKILIEKTGHVHIKKRMATEGALLGGEVSGHFFFKDIHPGFDDGLYGALRTLKLFAQNTRSLEKTAQELPHRETSPEMRLPCKERDKKLIIESIKKHLLDQKVPFLALDGIRVLREKEWWLVRASQTEASLIVRWEAFDRSSFESISQEIRDLLSPWKIFF